MIDLNHRPLRNGKFKCGHAFTHSNIIFTAGGNGTRCRACFNEYQRRFQAERRAATRDIKES